MIPIVSHCFCSDPFINYIHAVRDGTIRKGDLLILVSIGVGYSLSSAVIRQC
jgi:3-oxoacyl-[acyl-carrier-protein] synthase-3